MNNGYDVYRQNAVSTNTQGNLIIMLYEGAIRFINQSIVAMDKKEIKEANDLLIKAQNIFIELNVTLNYEVDESMAQSLSDLYTYFISRLVEANIKKDAKIASEVLGHVNELYLSWKAIINNG